MNWQNARNSVSNNSLSAAQEINEFLINCLHRCNTYWTAQMPQILCTKVFTCQSLQGTFLHQLSFQRIWNCVSKSVAENFVQVLHHSLTITWNTNIFILNKKLKLDWHNYFRVGFSKGLWSDLTLIQLKSVGVLMSTLRRKIRSNWELLKIPSLSTMGLN